MKKALLLLIAPAIMLQACERDRITGSGSTTTEERNVNNFTGIATAGSTDITVIRGAGFKVSASGYQNLLPYLETVVINNTLEVRFKNNVNIRNDNTHVTVTMPVLESLSISGSADITTQGDFVSNDFETRINGSGNIKLGTGTSKNFNSNINGSGDIRASNFLVENARVRINGSGNNHVNASGSLNVEIAGSGNVYYTGSPSLTVSVSGSGKVVKQ